MSGQVFISYRRDGGDTMAYLLWDRLLSLGYRVFYDLDSLSSGKFNEQILRQIEQSSHVLVILPKDGLDRCWNEDDWVRREIVHAMEKTKILVPIFLRGFKWPDNMPPAILELKNYQGVDMSDLRYFPSLLEDLEKILGDGGPAAVAPPNGDAHRILFWSDLPKDDNKDLLKSLEDVLPECRLTNPETPLAILRQERAEDAPDTIVLLVTDVTKLASDAKTRERINDHLRSFVRQGGRLICSHDIIYRRTQNTGLQSLYGCQITNFIRKETVTYLKTNECRSLGAFADLPDDGFPLDDGEVSRIQRTPPGAKVFFRDKQGRPLVFARKRGRGLCIWLNTGETTECAPAAIADPNFSLLLKGCLSLSF